MIHQNNSGAGNNFAAMRDINVNYSEPKQLSILAEIINVLGSIIYNDIEEEEDKTDVFKIEAKILYNNVIDFRPLLDEYKIFIGKLSSIYQEFDSQGTNKTHKVLSNIRYHYLKVKAEFNASSQGKPEIDVIRENADAIIQKVEERLREEINRAINITESVETINISLLVVIIDAFIKCKILEEPK